MKKSIEAQLAAFAQKHKFSSKGTLSVALVLTRRARSGLPLNPKELVTDAKGQVEGLGKAAVQSILAKHGITRVLAEEGGGLRGARLAI